MKTAYSARPRRRLRRRSAVEFAGWLAPPAATDKLEPLNHCGLCTRPNRSLKAGELNITQADGSAAFAPVCEITSRSCA